MEDQVFYQERSQRRVHQGQLRVEKVVVKDPIHHAKILMVRMRLPTYKMN